MSRRRFLLFVSLMLCLLVAGSPVRADRPGTAYIFPAGGQRGTTVAVRIGGYNLHASADFSMTGGGIDAPQRIHRGKTVFFEGPVIPQPASQRRENYPKDYNAKLRIAKEAALGVRYWRVATSQGVTPAMRFVVGDLPEVVEREIDGAPIPTKVTLPVTVNGRIFPRQDVDVWTFDVVAGRQITCEVTAARLGSPLDSRLEVRGPDGRRIVENTDAVGTDSRLTFTPAQTGRYSVRIHDVNFNGLQSYVYRLTISAGPHVTSVFPLGGRRGHRVKLHLTGAHLPQKPIAVALPDENRRFHFHRVSNSAGKSNRFLLELGDLPEFAEPLKPTDCDTGAFNQTESEQPRSARFESLQPPGILNGRIAQPGEIDEWRIAAKTGDALFLDLKAARLGSPLDSLLSVVNADGKTIATSDDIGRGQTDSQIRLKVPADGIYRVRVQDRLTSRGGPEFAYRLQVTKNQPPDFRILLSSDAMTVDRGSSGKLKLNAERTGGMTGEITLQVKGLPKGVTVTGTKIGKKKPNGQLTFTADAAAKVGVSRLIVTGTAMIDGKAVTRRAVKEMSVGEPDIDTLTFCVAVPTPFKFSGRFETKFAARGSTFFRHYKLERGGFEGPIVIKPADRQIRHLQGVRGPTIVLPPDAAEFDYPISLPPWMEIGRTCRSCLMAVGKVTDENGVTHTVSYSSQAQNDQIIVIVDPGRLAVRCGQKTLPLRKGATVSVPVSVARGSGLAGPVTVELVTPAHIKGVTAERIVIPAGRKRGLLRLQFAEKGCGPFNMPLTIRATLNKGKKSPFVAETYLSMVVDGRPTPVSYFASRR